MKPKITDPEVTDDMEGIMTREEVMEIIAAYEAMYGMSSEEFLRQWKAGTAPDTRETNDWSMLLDWI